MTSVLHFSYFNTACDHLKHCNDQVVLVFVIKILYFLVRMSICHSYIDKPVTNLHTGNDWTVGRQFYTTVHCLMMGQCVPKHVAVDLLKHNCNSTGLCTFVYHIVTIMIWSSKPILFSKYYALKLHTTYPRLTPSFVLEKCERKSKIIYIPHQKQWVIAI